MAAAATEQAEAAAALPELRQAEAAAAAARAGLTLSEDDFEQLCAAAPHVGAMVGRLRRKRGYGEEPSNMFTFPAG